MRALAKITAALALCLLGTAAYARATVTQKLVSEYAGKEPLRSAVVGILAVRANGDTLAQLNRGIKMVPASNVKIITTGLALTRLGAGWRFRTTLAYSGTVCDSVLVGDLYVVGGGDPTTGSHSRCAEPLDAVFGRFRSQLEYAGIRRIEGRIVADPRYFGRPTQHPFWQVEDLGFNYGAGPDGLNFYENAQDFSVVPSTPGTAPSIRPTYPEAPWLSWTVSAITGAARTPNTLYCINTGLVPRCEFFGSFPAERSGYTFQGSNPFGPWTYAYYLHKFLTANGITITNGYGDVAPTGFVRTDLLTYGTDNPAACADSLVTLGTVLSPPLSDIVADTNAESDNFFAETLFSTLGITVRGSTDRDEASRAEESLLKSMGLTTAGACTLVDGSGLSRKNYVSAEFFVKFLRTMLGSKASKAFVASLPTPGGRGTLKYRMAGVPAETKTRIKMKSGSMNGVRCMSGYILPAPGEDDSRTVIFSILTNNVVAASATTAQILDEIILSLAAEQ